MLALKTQFNYWKFFIFITCSISLLATGFQTVRPNVVYDIPIDEPISDTDGYSLFEDGIMNVARGIKSAHILVGCTMEQILKNTLY